MKQQEACFAHAKYVWLAVNQNYIVFSFVNEKLSWNLSLIFMLFMGSKDLIKYHI